MGDVARRCVFYVGGFDPKGAAHYHALYRDECARQAAADGLLRTVGPRRRQPNGNGAWEIQARGEAGVVDTHYECLHWDDIVRQHWPRSTIALWWQVIAATLFYLRHGTWWRMFRLSWPPAVAVFTPFLLVLALLLGTPLLAGGGGWWVAQQLQQPAAGGAAALLLAGGLWRAGRRIEARYSMYWLMRSYAFTARQGRGDVPALEQRLQALAQQVVGRVRSGIDDEVLVVGHSSGAIMAASILARALRMEPTLAAGRCRLALLTLGQWIPLLGLLPMARPFREELQLLGATRGLQWTDFSAPPDGCCFALTHPITACGVPYDATQGADVKLLNPRFAEQFDGAAYAALKRDKFLLHFQYLHAAPRAGDYDYFAITSGPLSLAQRYAAQPSVEDFHRLRWRRRPPA
jgi:hypothetical protein